MGDATNDVPMFEAAGLGVAMQCSMPEAHAA
ncbi:MAG: HAD family hydrolase, partial [Planctomycetota bacterium]